MAPEECLRLSSGLDIYTCKQCALSYDIPTLTQICMKADSGRKMPGDDASSLSFHCSLGWGSFPIVLCWSKMNNKRFVYLKHWKWMPQTHHNTCVCEHHPPHHTAYTIPLHTHHTPHHYHHSTHTIPSPHHYHHPTLPTHTEFESDQGRCNKGKCNSTVFCSLFFSPTSWEDHLELYQELGAHGTVQNRMISETKCLGVSMVVL